jgi:hypothetical protein
MAGSCIQPRDAAHRKNRNYDLAQGLDRRSFHLQDRLIRSAVVVAALLLVTLTPPLIHTI